MFATWLVSYNISVLIFFQVYCRVFGSEKVTPAKNNKLCKFMASRTDSLLRWWWFFLFFLHSALMGTAAGLAEIKRFMTFL